MIEEESQKRVELLIKKRVDNILEMRKQEIEDEIKQRVSFVDKICAYQCFKCLFLTG